MTVFEMIEAQQKGHEGTTVFTVGQHLKDICRADPSCAVIVAEDLQQKGMGIADCEKKIQELADSIQKKTKRKCVGVDFYAAEDAIRQFYGLPAAEKTTAPTPAPVVEVPAFLGLGDLMGL